MGRCGACPRTRRRRMLTISSRGCPRSTKSFRRSPVRDFSTPRTLSMRLCEGQTVLLRRRRTSSRTKTDARRTIQRPRTAATYDFDPGSLTEMDTYADATLATLRSEARHGPPVPKQELPYMREWETRQMSSRSTGSGLSMASHVIAERLRHMTHLFNVLPSFAEDEDAPGLLAAGAGESATSRSWLGDFMPADGSWMVPGISAPQRSSGDAARITPSAASLRSSLTRGTPPQTAVSFFPSANEPGHSHSQPIVSFAADGGPGETPHARPGSVSVVSPGTQSVMSAEGKGLEQGDKGGGGGGDSGGGSGVISFSRRSF